MSTSVSRSELTGYILDTTLKQRMIGAIVLTALAIIILPMLLDGSAQDRARVVARIPEPPAIQLKKLTVADIGRNMRLLESQSAANVPHIIASGQQSPGATNQKSPVPATGSVETDKASPVATASPDARATSGAGDEDNLKLDKNDLPVGWCLQVGSFKSRDNAIKLRENLRASHFRAYVIQANTSEGDVYRVFVGPMLEKAKLAQMGKKIESSFNLKGEIVRYRIEDDAGQIGG